jgi:Zn-dependent protease
MILLSFIQHPELIIYIPVSLLIGITIHEFMHAWVANYLGDPTPGRAGRISLNPLAHLDPLGTLALLFIGIGWGKPVPINPNNFKNPRLGSALTSIAGPLTNFLVADALLLIYRFGGLSSDTIYGRVVLAVAFYNLLLMIFNLIPIPPLDGSGFLALFFPAVESRSFQLYGPILLIILLFFTGFTFILPIIFSIIKAMGVNPANLYFLFSA